MEIELKIKDNDDRDSSYVFAWLSIDGASVGRMRLRSDNCVDLLGRLAVYIAWSEPHHNHTHEVLLKRLQRLPGKVVK